MNTSATQPSSLAHFPVALFSSVMGLAALTVTWFKAHQFGALPLEIGMTLRWATSGLYLLLLLLFGAKLLRYPAQVRADLEHPVKLNFFPAMSIGLMMLALLWSEPAPSLARWMWSIGAAVQLGFTLYTMSSWIHHTRYDIKHANPAWFIPVVGNILVPIAGVRLAPADLSWFFFSIGLVFWLVLMTIVLYRLFFHEPLPARLTPTLFILIAPPAVGFLSYVALVDQIDAFARILYFCALFLTLLLTSNAMRFFRLPFFISGWAYSFPIAAMALATFEMALRTGAVFYGLLSWILLAVLTSVVGLLSFKTLQSAARGQICIPD